MGYESKSDFFLLLCSLTCIFLYVHMTCFVLNFHISPFRRNVFCIAHSSWCLTHTPSLSKVIDSAKKWYCGEQPWAEHATSLLVDQVILNYLLKGANFNPGKVYYSLDVCCELCTIEEKIISYSYLFFVS